MKFSFVDHEQGSIRKDVLSGLTVALALVPEAVAFAFVAGLSPIVGLYGAFMMGIVTAIFGGRPGMISGATGAMAVVMVSLVAQGTEMGGEGAGLQYLLATLVLAGLLQIGAGVLRLGKFVRMIPSSVMMGFVNGLAIVIFMSQLGMFKVGGEWLSGGALLTMMGLTGLTMGIMWGLPKLTKQVPAALAAIVVVTLMVIFGRLETPSVASFVAEGGGDGIAAGLPTFDFPIIPFSLDTLWFIAPYACILAAIGLIESLMTLNLVDELTETRGNANRECIAQGAGNILNGFFGGMGGCAMIGQSMINVKSGGRTRIAGIAAALFLLAFILFASGLIEQIPLAALVGVMFMVVIGTFAWNSLRILRKVPRTDAFVTILVTIVTVATDLATAVVVGVIVSALAYAWSNATRIHAIKRESRTEAGAQVYEIQGPLFFGSVDGFLEIFDIEHDPDVVIVDFANSRVADQSALQAIEALAQRYIDAGKVIQLRHLSRDCHKLLSKAGHLMVDSDDDPDYAIAVDYSVKTGIIGGH